MSDAAQSRERQDPGSGAPMRAEGVPADSRPGRSCARCGAAVSWTVKVYCRNHEARFGGRTYCVGCQRAFPAI
jgi:hypothetical protein